MKNAVIAFSGKAQSGKTESSKLLKKIAEEKGFEYVQLSFARALKEIATKYFGWDGDKEIYYREPTGEDKDWLHEDGDKIVVEDKGRQLLINIGMKFRQIRPTIWVDIVHNQILEKSKEKPQNVLFCIDDLRFPNEVKIIESIENSLIVRLEREGQLSINDISETSIDEVEIKEKISNNGSLDDLAKEVERIFTLVLKD